MVDGYKQDTEFLEKMANSMAAAAALAASRAAAVVSSTAATSATLASSSSQTSSSSSSSTTAAAAAAAAAAVAAAISTTGTTSTAVTTLTSGSVTTATIHENDIKLKSAFPRLYNKIILTLENSLIPKRKLETTPSYLDGLDKETEKDLRILGCELIQTSGILLRLPQIAMATGQVIFQRFFYSKSFVRHSMEIVAMSCICLASKIEEAPRRIRDVINVFHHIKQVNAQKEIAPMILDQYYTNLKTQVIKAERRVLKELGFCVHVKHPHKLIVMYLQVLKYEKHQKLMQMSWNYMNDSFRTDVFMRYNPETIACACIYLSARKLSIPLPEIQPWFAIFRVTEDEIIDICYRVLELYNRPKPNVEKLEASVDELKKRYMESRNKTKEQNIPPAVTTVDRNNGSHNAWGGFIQRAIPLPLPNEKTSDKNSRSRSRDSRSPKFHSRSRSRTRSRSRSRSRSPTPESGEYKSKRSKKLHRNRARSHTPRQTQKTKKKSRHYSRSESSSSHGKHRKRKSRERERSEYFSTKDQRTMEKYRERDKYQERDSRHAHRSNSNKKHHHGYSHRNSRGGHHEHERNRDRKR